MIDLVCVIPLYGENCRDVSLHMVSSLALQRTHYNVCLLFYYDKTVKRDAINQLCFLLDQRGYALDKDYHIFYTENSASGYKRNQGLQFARENDADLIWFLDQDDYLLRNDVFESLIDIMKKNPTLDIIKLGFSVPDSLLKYNHDVIVRTPTMPWQYIFRVKNLEGYAFLEDCEYGSDIPITIRYLVEHGYYRFNENDTRLNLVKEFNTTNYSVYFYNYLNTNSYMNKHAASTAEVKSSEINYALQLIQSIKDKVNENN